MTQRKPSICPHRKLRPQANNLLSKATTSKGFLRANPCHFVDNPKSMTQLKPSICPHRKLRPQANSLLSKATTSKGFLRANSCHFVDNPNSTTQRKLSLSWQNQLTQTHLESEGLQHDHHGCN